MKRAIILLVSFIILVLAVNFVIYKYKNPTYEPSVEEAKLESQIRTNKAEAISSVFETNEDILETSSSDEKVSPNATLIIKKYYKKCGHTTEDYASIPEEIVNKTEEEVKKLYTDWNIQSFSEKQVVLYRELPEICKEHYILKEHNGVIAIYRLNDSGERIFEEDTSIATEYLPEEDLIRIQQGIQAIRKRKIE